MNNKPWMWIIALVGIILGIAALIYWLLVWRFEEYTNDAYVNGNQVVLTSQIAGYIQKVTVEDTQMVEEGELLVALDPTDKSIALDQAKSALADAVRQVVGMQEKVGQLKAEKQLRASELVRAGQDFIHRQKLLPSGAVSKEDYEHAEAAFVGAFASSMMVEHQLRGALAQVENTTVETHPLVLEAKETLRSAYVDLKRCEILSPVRGMVAQKRAQVGLAVNPNDPLMFLIPFDQMWVDANYKEVQLKKVRIGQKVSMHSDIYGRSAPYHGTVIGIGAGTGSVFSLLPPQNATGNWIKIVQRVPVRVKLDPSEVESHPLRLGLSMEVRVDLHDQGPLLPTPETEEKVLFTTTVFEKQLEGSEELIHSIIAENSQFSFELNE